MATVKSAIININGKVGNDIIVDGPKHGRYIRKVVSPGSKQHEPALKQQYTRTRS